MRYSSLFGKTRRDAPAGLTGLARRLAYRAGLLRTTPAGDVWMPLGSRLLEKMGGQLGLSLAQLDAQQLCAGGHVGLGALASQEIQSYKQLPARFYYMEAGGTCLHLAALEPGEAQAREAMGRMRTLAHTFLEWAEAPFRTAEDAADSFVWYTSAETGDLQLWRCTSMDYAATLEAARPYKGLPNGSQDLLPAEPVETPHCDTIESLARFLGVPPSRTAKAVFYSAGGNLTFAVIRGDLKIDEDKLGKLLGPERLRFATDDEIRRVGAEPGYASPVGVRGATVIVDDSIADSPNLVAGANRPGYHLLNTNVPRDYRPDTVADIARVSPGDRCPNGDGLLEPAQGIWLGQMDAPSALDATFLDPNGKARPVWGMHIAIDLAGIILGYIESHHDDKGIMWNSTLAPLDVHIVALNAERPEVAPALARLTETLDQAGVPYLLDDRSESAGVKFNDADLIGLPVRLTIGPRTVAQNAVEFKKRNEAAAQSVPLDEIAAYLRATV